MDRPSEDPEIRALLERLPLAAKRSALRYLKLLVVPAGDSLEPVHARLRAMSEAYGGISTKRLQRLRLDTLARHSELDGWERRGVARQWVLTGDTRALDASMRAAWDAGRQETAA